jgi:hypothetical protein
MLIFNKIFFQSGYFFLEKPVLEHAQIRNISKLIYPKQT